jgi:hypothetical protein
MRGNAVALPPLPLTLPLPPRRHQAATNVALSRYRHRCSLRAAATALPPLRCAPPPRFALPPPLRRRHAAANVALSRCRHRRSLRAAATTLPPTCCASPPPPRPRQANHGVSHLHLPSEMLGPEDIYFPPFCEKAISSTSHVHTYNRNCCAIFWCERTFGGLISHNIEN